MVGFIVNCIVVVVMMMTVILYLSLRKVIASLQVMGFSSNEEHHSIIKVAVR
jgi:hypothetical protein